MPETTPRRPYVREQQNWAVEQVRASHEGALYHIGEYALFALMWTIRDYDEGEVGYCTVCATDDISKAYGQPTRNKCPSCFGTRFEGGYRALIVRPAIFSDADDSQSHTARGTVFPQEVHLETTSDFRAFSGDYVMRATGERLQLRAPERQTIRTGFGTPYQSEDGVSYNLARAAVEDDDSVSYTIPPLTAQLVPILQRGGTHPVDFSDVEVIRSELIPAYAMD